MRDWVSPVLGNLAMTFADDRDLTDRHGKNTRLFFPSQHSNAILFPKDGPEALRGLTSKNIEERFGIAVGGALAPENAIVIPHSNALAANASLPLSTQIDSPDDPFYPMLSEHFSRQGDVSRAAVRIYDQ